jgi:hypothetical protein
MVTSVMARYAPGRRIPEAGTRHASGRHLGQLRRRRQDLACRRLAGRRWRPSRCAAAEAVADGEADQGYVLFPRADAGRVVWALSGFGYPSGALPRPASVGRVRSDRTPEDGGGQRDDPVLPPMSELGILLDARSVHPGLSARSNLLALARTAGIGRRRVDEVIELAGLGGLGEVAGTGPAVSPPAWDSDPAAAQITRRRSRHHRHERRNGPDPCVRYHRRADRAGGLAGSPARLRAHPHPRFAGRGLRIRADNPRDRPAARVVWRPDSQVSWVAGLR